MSNFIEKHPAYTLLTTFFAAMTIAFVVLRFTLYDNKINLHQAQIESKNAQIEHVKAENLTNLAKIDYLETENKKLEELNNFYFNWISNSDNPLPALKLQIKNLTEENNKLKEQQNHQAVFNQIDTLKTNNENNRNKYTQNQRIQKSSAYRDNVTEIIIGVRDISVLGETTTLHINFPDNTSKEEKVGAGQTFSYSNNATTYQLIVNKIDYVYNYVEVLIVEK